MNENITYYLFMITVPQPVSGESRIQIQHNGENAVFTVFFDAVLTWHVRQSVKLQPLLRHLCIVPPAPRFCFLALLLHHLDLTVLGRGRGHQFISATSTNTNIEGHAGRSSFNELTQTNSILKTVVTSVISRDMPYRNWKRSRITVQPLKMRKDISWLSSWTLGLKKDVLCSDSQPLL